MPAADECNVCAIFRMHACMPCCASETTRVTTRMLTRNCYCLCAADNTIENVPICTHRAAAKTVTVSLGTSGLRRTAAFLEQTALRIVEQVATALHLHLNRCTQISYK